MLESFSVAYNAYRGRGTCLYSYHYGFVSQKSAGIFAELPESLFQSFGNERRQPKV